MASPNPEELTTSLQQQRQPMMQSNMMPNLPQQIQTMMQNNMMTNIPQQIPAQTAPKARLQCHTCQRLLEYDAGARYVQCFGCGAMNAVQTNSLIGGQVLSMLCAICHTTNLAPYGVNYVRCGNCSTISQVSHAYRQNRMMSAQVNMPAGQENAAQSGQSQLELSQGTDTNVSTSNINALESQEQQSPQPPQSPQQATIQTQQQSQEPEQSVENFTSYQQDTVENTDYQQQ